MDKFSILVLCTGNSARSILLEHILNKHGKGRVKAYSAGSSPTGKVNPGAIEILETMRYKTKDAHSKSWDVFASDDAPKMDLVITVCSSAAGETCPIWPAKAGQAPIRHHYGIDDPAGVTPAAPAFRRAYLELMGFATAFLALDLDHTPRVKLAEQIRAITPPKVTL